MKKKAISAMLAMMVLIAASCTRGEAGTTIDDDPIEVSVDIEGTTTEATETTEPPETTMDPDISESVETNESGAHASEVVEAELPVPYEDIINKATDILNSDEINEELPEGFMGLIEAKHLTPAEEVFEKICYCCTDIDGNGSRELMFLVFDGEKKDVPRIMALFAIDAEGRANALADGVVRDRYTLLQDGKIMNLGSSGAAYTVMKVLKISSDGAALDPIEIYFTDEDGQGGVCWYKSLDGKVYDECTLRDKKDAGFEPEVEEKPVKFKQGDYSLFENKSNGEVDNEEG